MSDGPGAKYKYVVVVHGIGQQRLGETALPVIGRFAEARLPRAEAGGPASEVVTLGRAAAYLKHAGWVAFTGVTRAPGGNESAPPFLGDPAPRDEEGRYLRFVDVHWADLLEADVTAVGQPPATWAEGLLQRLKRKTPQPPGWAGHLLRSLAITLGVLHTLLAFRGGKLKELLFADYLGDVQVYGEHPATRAAAVRRLHDVIARAVNGHDPKDVEIHVVAHSLGTMMAFDALCFAHAEAILAGDEAGSELLLPGYRSSRAEAPTPTSAWIDSVRSFTTLGSPIDKFLVIWWQSYRHLMTAARPPEDRFRPRATKIRHLNFCEEQDPVGHHLELVRTTDLYGELFTIEEDRIYQRSALPGAAHVKYWVDRDLFEWILSRAIDGRSVDEARKAFAARRGDTTPSEPRWYSAKVHRAILRLTYFLPPLAFSMAVYLVGGWARHEDSVASSVLGGVLIVAVAWFGKQTIDLMIWWRQVLALKRQKGLPDVVKGHEPTRREAERDLRGRRFRRRWFPALIGLLGGVAALSAYGWGVAMSGKTLSELASPETLTTSVPVLVLALSTLVALVFWRYFLHAQLSAWEEAAFLSRQSLLAVVLVLLPVVVFWLIGHGDGARFAGHERWFSPLGRILADVTFLFASHATALLYALLRLRDVRHTVKDEPAGATFAAYLGAEATGAR